MTDTDRTPLDRIREDITKAVEYHSVGGREWLVTDAVLDAAKQFTTGTSSLWCETHNQHPAECSPTRGKGPGHFVIKVRVVPEP